jgi:glycosyltransferase involved in cell wall biosynthesis
VAVVTPSYQQAEFIEETIRSVLLQDYPKLSYVIMDGGSSDGSADIIRKYAPWLTDWVSEPDRGQASAIAKGFQRIGGDILAWLNSDDVFAPGAIWRAIAEFRRNQRAVLVYGNTDEIDRDGAPLGQAKYARQVDRQYLVHEANAIPQPSAYFQRAAYETAGGMDTSLHWTMDYDLWIRLAALGPIVYLPETLSKLRVYPEAKTSRGMPGMFDEFRRVGARYGGYGQLKQNAWMVPTLLPKAMAALRQGDLENGSAWLTTVIANDRSWRSEPRLAERLADEILRAIGEAATDPNTALQRVRGLCRRLPPKHISPKAVERRTLGLLLQALAFRSYGERNFGQSLRYSASAISQNYGQAINRGLWSIALRSMVKLMTESRPRL